MIQKLIRLILLIGILVCLTGCICFGANIRMIEKTRPLIYAPDEAGTMDADCILVLGCGLRADGYPSQMLRDRLDVAIAAYWAGAAPKLLMSGDHGSPDYDEVNAMKNYAMDKGVPSEDIFMDHAGFSTYESMYRAREIFQCEKIVVVTQQYHLYRALYNAQAMGMQAQGISSSVRSYARQPYFDLREAAARVKDTLWCIARPDPTHLGEVISIMGNGDVTNDAV